MMGFIEGHFGFSRDGGDESFEMMILVLGVSIVVLGGIYWADARQSKRDAS